MEGRNMGLSEIEVIELEFPHDSPLHDFPYDARSGRECPRRLLCSPYKGCSHSCVYCYANTKPYNPWVRGKIMVFIDYYEKVLNQLEKLKIIFPIYLSQDHDPFAPIEAKYKINLRLMEAFVEKGYPFEFITKSSNYLVKKALDIVNGYNRFFAQFTITTLNEELRKLYRKLYLPAKDGYKDIDMGLPTFGESLLDKEIYEYLKTQGEILEKIAPKVIKDKYMVDKDLSLIHI